GYLRETFSLISGTTNFYPVELSRIRSDGAEAGSNVQTQVDILIAKAIENKEKNDPKLAFGSYRYTSYNKLGIDKQRIKGDSLLTSNDPSRTTGRSFFSEKVSETNYLTNTIEREFVTGLKTHGFNKPVYEVLTLNTDPVSIYEDDYPLYGTNFAGPLGKKAFRNY